uniref:DUF4806 domain-containing protein n=1 Tax=Anopheles funestus TaxID=62324 RepID=A0A182RTM4_ANOFN
MEHSLNQRDEMNPSPASIEGPSTIKQEPLDEEMKEPKIEIPQEASFWECGAVDPLKEEIDIGETGLTVQDPFFMIEEIGIKVEPKVEKDEEIEDHGDTVDTSTKWSNLSDEVKSAGNCNVAKSPFLPEYSNIDPLSCSTCVSWTSQNCDKLNATAPVESFNSTELSSDIGSTKDISPVKSKEELDRLEEYLNNKNNMQRMATRINRLISQLDAANRFCEALFIVVSDKFLIQCSWTGNGRPGPKIAIQPYVNLQRLLQLVADKGLNRMEKPVYENILRSRLKNAKNRLRFKNMRRIYCKIKNNHLNSSHDIHSRDPLSDIRSTTEISRATSREELDMLDNLLNTEDSTQSMAEEGVNSLEKDDYENIVELKVNILETKRNDADSDTTTTMEISPVKSKEELDSLEEFLNTDNNMQDMVKCVNKLISAKHAANRFCEALYIVVNDKFLIQCSWSGYGISGPKIAMKGYVNLQRLLRLVAEADGKSLNKIDCERILKLKLKNARARLRFKGMRKIWCNRKLLTTPSLSMHETQSNDSVRETETTMEILPVKSKEELDSLEEFLTTDNNMQAMAKCLNRKISAEHAAYRFCEALYLVVNVKLLIQCSWSGYGISGPKIAMKGCVNLQRLLRLVAEADGKSLNKTDCERILKLKLKNARARLRFRGMRKIWCNRKLLTTNSLSSHESQYPESVDDTETITEISPAKSKEELDTLEEFLNTDNNMQGMAKCLNRLISAKDAANRFCEALYIVVYDKFLVQCSWSGCGISGPKIAMKGYVNLQRLLQLVADVGGNNLNNADCERILKLKLKNARTRLRFKGMKKPQCRIKLHNSNSTRCHEIQSPDPSISTESTSQITPAIWSTTEISPVQSKKDLDSLEEFLNTENNMQSMARRLNRLMSAQDVTNRFGEALHIIVSDKFLIQCSWLSGGKCSPKVGLQKYVNFVSLLRLLAENGVHTMKRAQLEKTLKLQISDAKLRLRPKRTTKSVSTQNKSEIS